MMTPEMSTSPEPEDSPAPGEAVPAVDPALRAEVDHPSPGPDELHGVPGAVVAQDAVPPQGMIPGRLRRRTKVERVSMRLLATGGIIGIAAILGAVLVGQDVAGWIVGVAVGLTSVILAALLWSSQRL